MWEAVALAFALAMDATAVAAARGFARGRSADLAILPVLFGGFQAGMAALGWLAGDRGGEYVAAWHHRVAFALLAGIGLKMLIDAIRGDEELREARDGVVTYLALAIATSIDAAAAGATLPLLDADPWLAIGLIGIVTAACTALGYVLGRTIGTRFGRGLEVIGGLVLIGLGVRVLVEHLA